MHDIKMLPSRGREEWHRVHDTTCQPDLEFMQSTPIRNRQPPRRKRDSRPRLVMVEMFNLVLSCIAQYVKGSLGLFQVGSRLYQPC